MADDDFPENPLFRLYERFFGEPDTETDVYLGFGLFFTAIGFGVIALGLALVANVGFEPRTDPYFGVMTWAFVLGMLALPSLMSGIVVLLPVDRKPVYAAAVGMAIVLGAVVWFYTVYPADWLGFGDDLTVQVTTLYAVGVAIVTGSTGAGLVAHQLATVRPPKPSEVQEIADEESAATEEEDYSSEEIAQDIEEAMADVDIGWGGVEESDNKQLSFNADFVDDVDTRGFDVEPEKRVETGGVDAQVSGLKSLKGGEKKTAKSEGTVDNELAALQELKRQKEADETPDVQTADEGVVGRLKDRIGLN